MSVIARCRVKIDGWLKEGRIFELREKHLPKGGFEKEELLDVEQDEREARDGQTNPAQRMHGHIDEPGNRGSCPVGSRSDDLVPLKQFNWITDAWNVYMGFVRLVRLEFAFSNHPPLLIR